MALSSPKLPAAETTYVSEFLSKNYPDIASAFEGTFSFWLNWMATHPEESDAFVSFILNSAAYGISQTDQPPSTNPTMAWYYHLSFHPAEMSPDVATFILKPFYEEIKLLLIQALVNKMKLSDATLSDEVANTRASALAEAYAKLFMAMGYFGAAWHDQVQGKRTATTPPMINETLSADAAVKDWMDKWKVWQATYQKSSGLNETDFAKACDDMGRVLPFLIHMLIVMPTYLVREKGEDQNKPLLYFFYNRNDVRVAGDLISPTLHMQAAQLAISFADTMRSLLVDVLDQQVLMNQVRAMPDQYQQVLDQLFKLIGVEKSPRHQEAFLLRLCQSFRMMAELNQFRAGNPDKYIKPDDLKQFMAAFSMMRGSEALQTPDAKALPTEGFKTFLLKYIHNSEDDAAFAKTLKGEDFVLLAKKLVGSSALLPAEKVIVNGWCVDHVKHLTAFREYVLNPPADSAKKTIFDQSLHTLGLALCHLAANQPGVKLLAQKKVTLQPVSKFGTEEYKSEKSEKSEKSSGASSPRRKTLLASGVFFEGDGQGGKKQRTGPDGGGAKPLSPSSSQ